MTSKSQKKSTEDEPNPRSISYSALTSAKKCGHFYRLKYLLKLYPDVNSVWTHYGTLVHKYIQAVLVDELDAETAAKKFIYTWLRFCRFWKKQLKQNLKDDEARLPKGQKNFNKLYINPARAIVKIKSALQKQFGNYKVLWIEHRLEEDTDFPQKFVGLIDVGIELENGMVVIIDLKTCSSHFMFNKYRDKYKDYQITLYKHYYIKQSNIDPKKIETYFVTIPKDPKVKKELDFIRVTSGKRKVANSLKWLNETLQKVQDDSFQKNRMACRNFYGKNCPFFQTSHCT